AIACALGPIPLVALEVAREVEPVAARGAGPELDDDRVERVDRGKARLSVCAQLWIRHQQKIFAKVLRQIVGQIPLVLGEAAFELPLNRTEGMRVNIIDECRERLAIVGEEPRARVGREFRADDRAESAPASQPAERIILRRELDADGSECLAAREQEGHDDEMECHRKYDEFAPAARQRPGNDQYGCRNKGGCRPVGLGARQEADRQHHRQYRQRKGGEETRARLGEGARRYREYEQAGKEQRAEHRELRAEEFEKGLGVNERLAHSGIVPDVDIANESVLPIPPEIRRIDEEGESGGGEQRAQVATLGSEEQ